MRNSQFCKEKNSHRLEQQPDIAQEKCRNNELVMHMSNLPVFLQHMKENSVQGKALNFGVLDWKRLEKWKNTTESVPGSRCMKESLNGKSSICSTNGDCEPTSSRLGSYEYATNVCDESGASYECHLDEAPGNRSYDVPHSCPLQNDPTFEADFRKDQHNMACSDFAGEPCTLVKAPNLFHKVKFSIGRLSRSSSFRDSSSVIGLSSGPSKPEFPSSTDRKLWRVLDSLMKRTKTVEVNKVPSQNKQVSKALLQMTLKNELPLYKFVVESSNIMLVSAATKAVKPDWSITYTFYSVSDIKKKSMNWLTRGSNSNSCSSLSYNIIGQMKISTSGKNNAKECILYGDDREQKHETAAIITNMLSKKKPYNGTVVILPGAIHGTPNKGTFSSLISRWKSDGSCDCGGWDLGCKLQVLEELQESTFSNNNIGNLNLFSKTQDHKSKPIFTMEQMNTGLYSVLCDDSVPILEMFAICVAHLTSQTCRLLESDTKEAPGPFLVQQTSLKYNTKCPPLSPASRI